MSSKSIEIITLYAPLLTVMIGTLGGIGNIITFTSKEFRFNSCAFYFLSSTIFDIIYLLASSSTRFLMDYFGHIKNDPFILLCKCRAYLVTVTPALSTLFIMLATIDRCLSTSPSRQWRRLSRMSVAWCMSMLIIMIASVTHSPILFFNEIKATNASNHIYKCVPVRSFYTVFINTYLFLFNPFLIYTIMLTCSLKTLIRMRTLRCRLGSVNDRSRTHRIIDRHLITIMLVHVGLGMLLTLCRCAFLVYTLRTNHLKKNTRRATIELFIDKLTVLMYYINFAKSFPVNILTSILFRRIFQQRLISLSTHLCSSFRQKQSISNRVIISYRPNDRDQTLRFSR